MFEATNSSPCPAPFHSSIFRFEPNLVVAIIYIMVSLALAHGSEYLTEISGMAGV